MIEWTQAAEQEFERHFDLIRSSFEDMGADPSEVENDLRRHIEEEMDTNGVTVVTEEDVKRIMARMDPMENMVKQQPPSPSLNPARAKESKIGEGATVVYSIAGIVLPTIVLLVELSSGMCAESFFDPIPTIWHVLFVAFVPVSNFLLLFGLQKPMEWNWRLLGWLNGIAIAISLYYSIVFLPLVPIGIIAILFVGYGFLPLAPLMAFLSALWIRGKLRNALGVSSTFRIPGLVGGIVFVLVAFLVVDLPLTFTRMGLNMVASDDAETQKEGIELLRSMGNEKLMLRYCYQRAGSRRTVDFLGSILAGGDTVGPSDARKAFYRVTGKPFNTFPPPAVGRFGRGAFSGFDFDSDEGGTVVGGRVSGVSLSSSRIDGSLAPNAALGYLEWTLEFKNSSSWQREARAQIALPAGGVVSRLTLWVHGEEKEAAFASRAKTRAAYESVVRRRRDPVLVTTSGPDRVLVQCFPVPPDGGTMKIRLGITVPLNLIGRDHVSLRLPYFTERNFRIGADVKHSVWIESKQPLETNSTFLREENPKEELYAIRGILDDTTLSGPDGIVRGIREPEVTDVWSPDTITDNGFIVHKAFE
ncbi:MAG: hypothetical protein KC964_11740, partial [Candidatus Omnitrophica bacterium]|nr:hypothetical protein [Candidatus Omnitrophota bacterium]